LYLTQLAPDQDSIITWATLLKFLQFVREHSNWTTLIRLSFEDEIKRCHDKVLEGVEVVHPLGDVEGDLDALFVSDFQVGDRVPLIHEVFNWEQREILVLTPDWQVVATEADQLTLRQATEAHRLTLRQARVEDPAPTQAPALIPHLPTQAQVSSFDNTVKKKKELLIEMLALLEKQAELSELGEGKYKEYADLLMEFFQVLRWRESMGVTNV